MVKENNWTIAKAAIKIKNQANNSPQNMGQDPFGFGSLDDLYRSLSRQMQQGILMNNKHHPLNLVMVVMESQPRGGAGAGQGLLGEYGINITEAARQGDIDPVVGRDQEIKRVIEILNRRTKTTPF